MSELIIAAAGVGATTAGVIIAGIAYSQGAKNEAKKAAMETEKAAKAAEKDAKNEGHDDGEMRSDIRYIRRTVEDIRVDQRATDKAVVALAERVTRTEESAKQAHKRIDDHQKLLNELR